MADEPFSGADSPAAAAESGQNPTIASIASCTGARKKILHLRQRHPAVHHEPSHETSQPFPAVRLALQRRLIHSSFEVVSLEGTKTISFNFNICRSFPEK